MAARIIASALIRAQVSDAIGEIYCRPSPETAQLLNQALAAEADELARDLLEAILANHVAALSSGLPLCQDTGLLVVFAQLGHAALVEGDCLEQVISSAAAEAWQTYHLRDSIAIDPLRGCVTGSDPDKESASGNLPVILHLEQVPGDQLVLHLALKGGGAENCGALRMFEPGAACSGIEEFVVDTVVGAGGRPCPPVFVGVGIGGDFETCAVLAKRALVMPGDSGPGIRQMEERILAQINQKGKGVMGMAGSTTALKVSIQTRPCHIASLPVAVNLDCHAHRVTTRVI